MKHQVKKTLSYVIGVALGDGNLSNPNGRAVRLRVTCDTRYPQLTKDIISALRLLLPANKVTVVRRAETYCDISVYSNQLTQWMPWAVGKGSKQQQLAHVPRWIQNNRGYAKECLRGLLQTDGSIYKDRGYTMINFCNNVHPLASDVYQMIQGLGYRPTITETPAKQRTKYTVRLARDVEEFIGDLNLHKT